MEVEVEGGERGRDTFRATSLFLRVSQFATAFFANFIKSSITTLELNIENKKTN